MEIYTLMFKLANKTKNPGSERVAWLTPPLKDKLKDVDSKSVYRTVNINSLE